MVVALIIACEVGFWVLLALGILLRYVAKMPKASTVVLLCEPVLEVVLFVTTVIDLRNGAEPDWKHGLAAVYIGYSAALGHSTVKWVDARVAHRFFGGPPPVKPAKYGAARTLHEWKTAGRWVLAAVIAMALLQGGIWYVGDDGEIGSLRDWQLKMLFLIGINVAIALSYTLFPKRERSAGGGPAPPPRARHPPAPPRPVAPATVRPGAGRAAGARGFFSGSRPGPTGRRRPPCWPSGPG
ncbi:MULTISPECIES: hypothetical protein [Streptomyces]|uniref:hypothetical protein n=1 Tax=Streptomyces lycopersici TaxID=2974589 RepID=UPI0021D0491A|nr:hypothetical protein [Streptomyces sp. NEAU-383]